MPASPRGTPEHPEQVPDPPFHALAGEVVQVIWRQVFIPHRAGHGDPDLDPCFVDYLLRDIDEYSVSNCIGTCVSKDDFIVCKGRCEGHSHSSPCMPIENVWFSLILISRERFQISLMIAPSRICSMVRSWSNRRLNSLRIVSNHSRLWEVNATTMGWRSWLWMTTWVFMPRPPRLLPVLLHLPGIPARAAPPSWRGGQTSSHPRGCFSPGRMVTHTRSR